jgi:dipeptidyl-peptidase-4
MPSQPTDSQAVFDQYLNNLPALLGGGVVPPNWLTDGSFWIAEGAPANTLIFRYDTKSGQRAPMFDVARTRKAVAEALGFEPAAQGLPFASFVDLGDGDLVQVQLGGVDWTLSRKNYTLTPVPQPGLFETMLGRAPEQRMTPRMWKRRNWLTEAVDTPEVVTPDLQWLAGVRNGNIYLRSVKDARDVALTHCATAEQQWDIESLRVRLGSGLKLTYTMFNPFSPNGVHLFACKYDVSRVSKAPLVHYQKREEELQWIPNVRAGGEMDQAQPYLIDMLNGRQTRLDIGDARDQFVQFQGWMADSSEVVFVTMSRDCKTIRVLAANALSGAVRVILEEHAKTFVRIQHDVIYANASGLRLLADGSGFVWESERSGWKHFYLYDMQGQLLRQLTDGDFAVTGIDTVDHVGGWLYFSAHSNAARPYDVHVCRVPLAGGEMQVLTTEEGLHQPKFSYDNQAFVDIHGSVDRPMQSDLRRADGGLLATVARADLSTIRKIGWSAPEEFKALAADGKTELWGVLYKPHDFDPSKKYPIIEHIYGGPQMALVPRTLQLMEGSRFSNLHMALAQLGYIVMMVDARGTPERSKEFQDVVYGDWGQHVVDDHAAVVKQLGERHSYIDTTRVGIWGHSWGGHFSFRCMAMRPDIFHAAFVSAPGFSAWDAMIYEPYLDLPQRNKAAYDAANCFPLAGLVKGKLTLAAGSSDVNTYRDVLKMSRELIEHGIDHETVVVTGDTHAYVGKGEEYVFFTKLVKFFEANVKNREQASQ